MGDKCGLPGTSVMVSGRISHCGRMSHGDICENLTNLSCQCTMCLVDCPAVPSASATLPLLAWAQKRGYFTAKAARLDAYRAGEELVGCKSHDLHVTRFSPNAANSLLRLACDGRVCFYLCPPGFQRERGQRSSLPEGQVLVQYC